MPSLVPTATTTVTVTVIPPGSNGASSSLTTNPSPSSTGSSPIPGFNNPFYITVNVNGLKSKRASFYVTFNWSGYAFMADTRADAALFAIDEVGHLLAESEFFFGPKFGGTSVTDGTAPLEALNDLPVNPFLWAVDGSRITFGTASFCVDAIGQFYVVYGGEPRQGCIAVDIAAEAADSTPPTNMSTLPATVRATSSALFPSSIPATVGATSSSSGVGVASSALSLPDSTPATAPPPAQSTTMTTFSFASTSTSTSSTSRISCVHPAPPVYQHVPPRGVPYGNVSALNFYGDLGGSRLSWAYNYYSLPVDPSFNNTGPFPPPRNPYWSFYPLLFNADDSLTSIWEANVNSVISTLGTNTIFSFNEPDLCVPGSACMTVEEALVACERYIQPFADCGVKLSAPSVSNDPSGFVWLTEFMDKARQRNLTIDIINIHWFGSPDSIDYFEAYIRDAKQRFNNQTIWLTEYGMDRDYGNETAVLEFMRQSYLFLELQSGIPRYA